MLIQFSLTMLNFKLRVKSVCGIPRLVEAREISKGQCQIARASGFSWIHLLPLSQCVFSVCSSQRQLIFIHLLHTIHLIRPRLGQGPMLPETAPKVVFLPEARLETKITNQKPISVLCFSFLDREPVSQEVASISSARNDKQRRP